MGVVKRDVHKNEYLYRVISFSDVDCIKGLIKHRSMIDIYYEPASKHINEINQIAIQIAEIEMNKKNQERFEKLKEEGKIPKNKKYKYKKFYKNQRNDIIEASNITELNQELICVYADLDNLIKKTSLNDKQRDIIEKFMSGLDEYDIGLLYKQRADKILNILDTACEKICNEYKKRWRYHMAEQDYIKIEWDYKKCSKCGENLPATRDFFSPDLRNKDGLHSICKKCR
jgi:hypothetical protein